MQGKVEIAGVNTAKLKVLKNEETMELLRRTKAGDQEARRELMQICGVGPKVADCVLLFGFHRLECCPVDVWMKRVFAVLYPNGLPDCARDFAGIAQQYLFHYARTCPQAFDPEEVSA